MKGELGVWKGNFYKPDSAQKKAFTSAYILSVFHHTGLWLVDSSIVEERINIGLTVQERSKILPSDRPVTSPFYPLFSLSPTEVYQISTSYSPREVHQLHYAIATEFSQINNSKIGPRHGKARKLRNSSTS